MERLISEGNEEKERNERRLGLLKGGHGGLLISLGKTASEA
jgi:hypothetical protein